MSGRTRGPRGWAPRGAVAFAVFALVALAGPAVVSLLALVNDVRATGEKFDGLGTAIGALGLVLCVVVAAPLASFLRRGGKVTFWTGAAVWTALWLFLLNLGFASELTGVPGLVLLVAAGAAGVVTWRRTRVPATA